MDQPELFHETIYEALKATVAASGGVKAIACALWPEKPMDEAARYLSDCLNPDRAANLSIDKLTLLLKLARAKGVHLAIAWILDDIGYAAPVPVEPEDQQSELMRQFIRAVSTAKGLGDQLSRLNIRVVEDREARR